jgi:hypothetical protein
MMDEVQAVVALMIEGICYLVYLMILLKLSTINWQSDCEE